jgi:hypothetical protein
MIDGMLCEYVVVADDGWYTRMSDEVKDEGEENSHCACENFHMD